MAIMRMIFILLALTMAGWAQNQSLSVLQYGKIPQFHGQNSAANDPVFHTLIIQATDAASCRGGFSIFAGVGGSADVPTWNSNDTKMFIEDSGGAGCVLNYNKTTHKITPCTTNLPDAAGFDPKYPNFLWTLSGSQLSKVDLTNCAAPVVSKVFDFASDRNCGLPSTVAWSSFSGPSPDGLTFAAGFSAGPQGSGTNVAVYKISGTWSGCRNWNTATGVIGGKGVTGKVTIPDRFHVHNVKGSGPVVVVAPADCIANCTHGPYPWTVAGLKATSCPSVCGGHWTSDSTTFVNNASTVMPGAFYFAGQWSRRLFSSMALVASLVSPVPAAVAQMDEHISWPNPAKLIAVATTTSTPVGSPITGWGQNEILGIHVKGGPAFRYGHTFTTIGTPSQYFSCRESIGTVSPVGDLFMVTSDMSGTLGTDRNGNPRCDVFIYDLRTAS